MKLNNPLFLPQEERLMVPLGQKSLTIGLPLESNTYENRVALTPEGIQLLVQHGHTVLVEKGAGVSSRYSDLEYSEAGGVITADKTDVYSCPLVVKVTAPSSDELKLLKSNQILLSAIQINSIDSDFINSLKKKGITALNYGRILDEDGRAPFVRSMSEIAGNQSISIAMECLNSFSGGQGYSLGGVTGVPPAEVVILGAGTVGTVAARIAVAMGSKVKVFDSSMTRMQRLREQVGHDVFTCTLQPQILSKALKECQVAIGAMRPVNGRNLIIVTEEMVSSMKTNSIIVDVSIDNGGCFETSEVRSLESPLYRKKGVIHFSVPNIASRVARTASFALNNLTSSFIVQLGEDGDMKNALQKRPYWREGVYIYEGTVTHREMAEPFGIPFTELNLLL
jgi:alanine dehydrogenase|tara:strand:- start:17890 stop:19074 length:1185 start_codon:yes stop_codon:yes gene_type:complete